VKQKVVEPKLVIGMFQLGLACLGLARFGFAVSALSSCDKRHCILIWQLVWIDLT